MLRLYPSEEFREIQFVDKPAFRYAISNFGRLVSFSDNIREGNLIKGSNNNGTIIFRCPVIKNGKKSYKAYPFSQWVAAYFIPKTSEDQTQLFHIDYDTSNNHVSNLKWATPAEKMAHYTCNPKVIAGRKKVMEQRSKSNGHKLTITKVMLLKKRLLDPNRKTRLKILARQFGISEMQLYRIKSGKNWGHIKV